MVRQPFIALEGIDGSGKSTQAQLLGDWLGARGVPVVLCAEPGGTPIGQRLRSLLLDPTQTMGVLCEAFLFLASRAELTAQVIRPALEGGSAVVSDRYLLSTVAYQGHAGGLDPGELWGLGRLASGGLEPDLSIILDVPVERALDRRKPSPDRLERRGPAFHEAVRRGFLAEAETHPERLRVVDGSLPIENVHALIVEEVARVLAGSPRA